MAVASPDSEAPVRDDDADERTLVARARARDARAFRELIERHRRRATALALRVLGSEADAEDTAQEAFVRAWFALPSFRGEARFSTWLHAIVMRRALDRAAQRRARQAREIELDAAAWVPDTQAALADRAHLAHRLDRIMHHLSAAQRAVVVAFYQDSRSVDEIASMLRMPTGTVKTHLSRARRILRNAWLRQEGTNA